MFSRCHLLKQAVGLRLHGRSLIRESQTAFRCLTSPLTSVLVFKRMLVASLLAAGNTPPPSSTYSPEPLPGSGEDGHVHLKAMTSPSSHAGATSTRAGRPLGRGGAQGGASRVFSVLASPGAPFQRSQHPHATSCRHFHLGPPQPQQLAPDFPLAHPVQSQPGLSAHMAPAHQHSGTLHQSLTPLPTLQFQDVTGPSFLPQALHQQYLLQQQLLEAQHRRLVSHPRWAGPGRGLGRDTWFPRLVGSHHVGFLAGGGFCTS